LDDRAHSPDRAQITGDLVGDVGVLNLYRDVLAVVNARAVNLTEGGDRERLLVEGGKDVVQAGVEVVLDHPARAARRKRFPRLNQRPRETRRVTRGSFKLDH
jgi:hypothetical protein